MPSCQGCVKKVSKKATEFGLSAIEGVSEAFDEHGARVGEKATDALGALVEGAGTSIADLLDQHASTVATVAGRTLVHSFEGFKNGIATEFYDRAENVTIVAPDREAVASIEFMGKMSTSPIVDTYLVIDGTGIFAVDFVFEGADGALLMEKSAEIEVSEDKKHTVVSFALSSDEEAKWAETESVKIRLIRKSGETPLLQGV